VTFPAHVVCEWTGNSQRVAARHYLQVTDEHFRRAASPPDRAGKAVQKAVQSAAAAGRGLPQADGSADPENEETPVVYGGLQRGAVPGENVSEPQGGPDWTRTNDLLHVKQNERVRRASPKCAVRLTKYSLFEAFQARSDGIVYSLFWVVVRGKSGSKVVVAIAGVGRHAEHFPLSMLCRLNHHRRREIRKHADPALIPSGG